MRPNCTYITPTQTHITAHRISAPHAHTPISKLGGGGVPPWGPSMESPKNRFWELLATIWHRFGAARSNLDGFWTPWARFFIDLAFIFEWIERGFCKQSLDEQYALVAALNMALLLSHCIFSLTSGAAGCASRLRRLPNGECTAC